MKRFLWLALVGLATAAPLLAQEPTLRMTLDGHTQYISCVAFSPDGNTLASGSLDNTIRLWDVATGESTATLKAAHRGVTSVAFSPHGKTLALACGDPDNTVTLWDIGSVKGPEN